MESIGSYLKQHREQVGVGLEEITSATKIRRGLLLDLEADRLDSLPGGVFLRGFIRSHCSVTGADVERALDILDHQTGTQTEAPYSHELPMVSHSGSSRNRSGLFKVAMVTLALLGLIGAYIVTSTVQEQRREVTSVESTDVDSGTTRSFSPVNNK